MKRIKSWLHASWQSIKGAFASLPALPWAKILLVAGILVVAAGIVWGATLLPKEYFIYLPLVAAVGIFAYASLFHHVKLSGEQITTLVATGVIMVLGGIMIPQQPLWMYITLTGGLPFLLSLLFLTPTGSRGSHYAAVAAMVAGIMVLVYLGLILFIPRIDPRESLVFATVAAVVIFFFLLPSIRSYFLPRGGVTVRKRSEWITMAGGVCLFLLAVIAYFHGADAVLKVGEGALRFLVAPVGILFLIGATWWFLPPGRWFFKTLITIALFVLLVSIWVKNLGGTIWMGLLFADAAISTSPVLYWLTFLAVGVVGYLLARRLRLPWLLRIIVVAIFMGLFFWYFGFPSMSWENPSGGNPSQQKSNPITPHPLWGDSTNILDAKDVNE